MPQRESLDRSRWAGLWNRLGARGDAHSMFTVLEAAYAEPTRFYHTADHIGDCLAQFDLSRSATQRPDEVEAGIWFHDAVYQPSGTDNEQRSANLALTSLTSAGVGPEVAHRIAGLVMSTRHLEVPTDPDAALLCDIDLSILGRATDVFDEFERRIRREYAWVPEPVYRGARAEILAGLLGRTPIFQTEYFRHRYEAPARANLERTIARLAG